MFKPALVAGFYMVLDNPVPLTAQLLIQAAGEPLDGIKNKYQLGADDDLIC